MEALARMVLADPMVDISRPGFRLDYKGAQVWPPQPIERVEDNAVEAYPSTQHETARAAARRAQRQAKQKRRR